MSLPTYIPHLRRTANRRGASYVFVLAVGMLLAVVCTSVLVVSRIAGRGLKQANDTREAEVLAESAIELALQRISDNTNWRSTYTSGVETSAVSMGDGTMTFKLVDETDGNLSNNNTDAVRLYGIGRVNSAAKVYSIQAAVTKPLTCLYVSVASAAAATLSSAVVSGGATISSNGALSATSSTLNGTNLEAAGGVATSSSSGTGYRKTISARTMPDTSSSFSFYVSNGTSIPIASFPLNGSSQRVIQNLLFSPAANPAGGSTNPSGIYVIDCQNTAVQISNCRVVGTLVLWNVGSGSIMQGSEHWVPAISNYPTLLVKGDMAFQMTGADLQDNAGLSLNFNPAGTPYNGVSDATYTTTYPCRLEGLVYVSGNVTTSGTNTFKGVLVAGGTLTVGGTVGLTYDATFYNNPPPGFVDTTILAPVPGTWKWEAAP